VADPHKRAVELYAALVDFPAFNGDHSLDHFPFRMVPEVVNTVYWPASREAKILYERAA